MGFGPVWLISVEGLQAVLLRMRRLSNKNKKVAGARKADYNPAQV
jgi:hypothetical protein